MTPEQALNHFGTQANIARAADVEQPSVFLWFKNGRIPALSQLRLEEAAKGELRADPDIPRGWQE